MTRLPRTFVQSAAGAARQKPKLNLPSQSKPKWFPSLHTLAQATAQQTLGSRRSFTSQLEPSKDKVSDAKTRLNSVRDRIVGRLSITPAQEASVRTFLNKLSVVKGTFDNAYTRMASTPYGRLMRLDKPIGSHLLFLPGAWGISIAATSTTDFLSLTALFYGGAVLLRGAGCTINDIWDVDIDRKVARTRSRPVAAGEISVPTAFVFLGGQLISGLAILTQLNSTSFLVGTMSILPLLFYPLAKRQLAYPQAVLGLTFNWSALLGYAAAADTLGFPALWLYGAGWCWTMVYDTIYAHQDKQDDEKLGVHSTALSFDKETKPILGLLTAGKLAFLTAAGLSADLSLPYFMGITASSIHLTHQVYATDLSDGTQCHAAFISNSTTGAITWLSILAGRLL